MYFDAAYVIESIPEGERKTGSELYDEVIRPASFKQSRLLTKLYVAADRSGFEQAMQDIARRARDENRWPVIHFEAHAGQHGTRLSSGEYVTWHEFAAALQPICVATHLNLLVTIAACSGGYLARTLTPVARAPAWAVIGPAEPVSADHLRQAFGAFYAELLESLDGTRALAALRAIENAQRTKYLFLPAVTMFVGVFRRYLREECTNQVLIEREREILEKAKHLGLPPGLDDKRALASIRSQLRDHKRHFVRLHKNFFMLDLYPENAARFRIRFSDAANH